MKQKETITPKLQRSMVSFSSVQSRILEAPLVRQADGELKKEVFWLDQEINGSIKFVIENSWNHVMSSSIFMDAMLEI